MTQRKLLSFMFVTFVISPTLLKYVTGSVVTKITWNTCVPAEKTIAVIRGLSLKECAAECLRQTVCDVINFNRRYGTCRLSKQVDLLTSAVTSCSMFILVTKADLNLGLSSTEPTDPYNCPQENLNRFPGHCDVRGNMAAPENKVLLESCYFFEHDCEKSIWECNAITNDWVYNKCLKPTTVIGTVDPVFPPSDIINVVLHKTVTMSSLYDSISPGTLLVDGDRNETWPCACTLESLNPYMQIDLGVPTTITHVFIVNRWRCCPERLHDVRISFGLTSGVMRELVYVPGQFPNQGVITLEWPITVRFIYITIVDHEFLTICEFEAWNALA